MRCFRSAIALTGLFLLCLCLPAYGAEGNATLVLDSMEVVSTPIIEGNQVDNYGALTTKVGETQIENLKAHDLGNALRMSPGVTISRYNKIGSFGGGEGGAIFIRGMGASRPGSEIKTYIDGVPVYMGVWNHPLLDLLSIDPAQSITVAKSPQPQNFGNAMAMIDLEPKSRSRPGYTTEIQKSGGSYSTLVETAEHGGKKGPFDYYLGQGYKRSDGHRDHSGGTMRSSFGRVGYELNDSWQTSFFGLYTDNEAEDPGPKWNESASEDEVYKTNALLGAASLSHDHANVRGEIKLFANSGEGDWLNQEGSADDTLNDFLFYGLKLRENLTPWQGGEIVLGSDWERTEGDAVFTFDDGSRNKWDGEEFTLFSPYIAVNQNFTLGQKAYIRPSAGIRAYEHSEFDTEYAPHGGLVLGYSDTELHMGYSRGVLYPGLEVAVLSQEVIPALGDSWKDLDAETVDHYEAGLSHSFADLATADVTFFYDDGQNRYVISTPPPPPPEYENVEDYRRQGMELTFSLTPMDNLSLFTGLTLLDTDPSDMPYAPDCSVSSGINWNFLQRFALSLDSQYVSSMHVGSRDRSSDAANEDEVDSHFLINGKLSYALPMGDWAPKGKVFVSGKNLTDTDYAYRPGYPMPGINGMLGVELTL